MNAMSPLALGFLAAFFALLFIAERLAPLRARRRRVLPRIMVNAGIALPAVAVAGAVLAPTAAQLLAWADTQRVGLFRWLDLPFAVEAVVGLLLFDLTFYWWHRANHAVPLLWRFHATHHVDPDLDVTTATRFHAGELLLSVGFRAAQITLLGVPASVYLAYEVVFQTGTLFHHSNLRLPPPIERGLSLLVVTPSMHGTHHSQRRAETCSNFSVVFNLWDRIHRTLRLGVPQDRLVIGVPAYDDPEDNRFIRVLAEPFRGQRDYWNARRQMR